VSSSIIVCKVLPGIGLEHVVSISLANQAGSHSTIDTFNI
jgi:hypothetical protein